MPGKSHGMSQTNIYSTWSKIKGRCLNSKNESYKNYGARGISLCKRWYKFENFYKDMGNKPSPSHEIERINNNGSYSKKNCKWATIEEQANNKRTSRKITFNKKTLTLSRWARLLKLTPGTLHTRLSKLSVKEALTKPNRYYKFLQRTNK